LKNICEFPLVIEQNPRFLNGSATPTGLQYRSTSCVRSSIPIATPHLANDSGEYFGPIIRRGLKYGRGS